MPEKMREYYENRHEFVKAFVKMAKMCDPTIGGFDINVDLASGAERVDVRYTTGAIRSIDITRKDYKAIHNALWKYVR